MGLNDLAEDKEPKTWSEKAKEAGLEQDSVNQVNEFPDTRTGRILRSASKGRDQPPPPSHGEKKKKEKPCPACATLSRKYKERGSIIGYKCENDKCGVQYFRLGWNEFRTEESFLSGVKIMGRKND